MIRRDDWEALRRAESRDLLALGVALVVLLATFVGAWIWLAAS